MNQKIVAIIQARMGASRFSGKVLVDIQGSPMLWHIVHRVREAKGIQQVVVATSQNSQDDPIFSFCRQKEITCFRGSEEDVLDRFYQAAREYKADAIVRLTADCPLLDPKVIDRVVRTYLEGEYDYVSNILRYTYPDGLDTEVFSFLALEKAWEKAKRPLEREHVTPYIRSTKGFRLCNVEAETNFTQKNLRWTVDEPSDLEFVRAVYSRLSPKDFVCSFETILNLLEKEPDLLKINQNIIRNEGAYKTLTKENPIPPQSRSLERSYSLKEKALELIPSGSQTFSKAPSQFVQGVAPVFLERGEGSHVWDVDRNEYIDYPMALGPVILGHHYPAVTQAVTEQIKKGNTFSLPHPLEVEVAEILTEIIPCAEMVRFGKNGSDVTSGAVRLARAYTGREIIACSGYHGWHDWFIGTTTRNKGVPKALSRLTVPFNYNDVGSLEKIFAEYPGKVAAVIMEPVGVVEPKNQFLQKVAGLAKKEGALLIFDEVLTGLRFALGGAQEYFEITPDLACFGKAIANGYPLSALVGSKEIMKVLDEVFFSFTFGGETASLAAAKATLTEMREKRVIDFLWSQGSRLKDGYNILAKEYGVDNYTKCIGYPPRTSISFKDESGQDSLLSKSLFQQECLKRGILFSGSHNICFSHTNADIDYTLRVYRTVLEIFAEAISAGKVSEWLEGEVVKPVFRKP